MQYEKPQIVALAPAMEAVQARKGFPIKDSDCDGGVGLTACAYESDE